MAAAPATTAELEPDLSTGVRRSTRARQKPTNLVPSWKGQRYSVAVTMLELQDKGTVHPDNHMCFLQDMVRDKPDAVAAIMTQLSLKAGMKAWGPKAVSYTHLTLPTKA